MEELFTCDRCGDDKPIGDYRVVGGYRWKKCRACIATRKREKREEAREGMPAVRERERKAETTAWARIRRDREERERKAKREADEAIARKCKLCGKKKLIDQFKSIVGKYRSRKCLICLGIENRQRLRTDARRAWKRERRKILPKERRKSPSEAKPRDYRRTPIKKLARAISDRKRKIRQCSDPDQIGRMEADVIAWKAMIDRMRRDLDCSGKRGPKPPGYGSIRIPDAGT